MRTIANLLPALLLLAGCASEGGVDEGFARSQEESGERDHDDGADERGQVSGGDALTRCSEPVEQLVENLTGWEVVAEEVFSSGGAAKCEYMKDGDYGSVVIVEYVSRADAAGTGVGEMVYLAPAGPCEQTDPTHVECRVEGSGSRRRVHDYGVVPGSHVWGGLHQIVGDGILSITVASGATLFPHEQMKEIVSAVESAVLS